AALLTGGPGSERRKSASARMRAMGVELDELLASLSGDLVALVYFDAEGFLANLINGSEKPEPRGSVLLESGLKGKKPLEKLVASRLDDAGLRFDRVDEKDSTRFKTSVLGQPVD